MSGPNSVKEIWWDEGGGLHVAFDGREVVYEGAWVIRHEITAPEGGAVENRTGGGHKNGQPPAHADGARPQGA